MIKVGVLTSSRADYGIYKPLLDAFEGNNDFQLTLIAFGTHLSGFHGYTLDAILKDGFAVKYKISSMLLDDDASAIASACALTSLKFSDFWMDHKHEFDVVFCLGDRYEMWGAVSAGIPFGVKFAHLHGGETTLGAIDNIYRHCITLASTYHFTSNEHYSEKIKHLTGSDSNIFTVGALSLDNLSSVELYGKDELQRLFSIDLSCPMVLVTYHPETILPEKNLDNINILSAVIKDLKGYSVVISLPNADTYGSAIRQMWYNLKKEVGDRIVLVENFGTKGYFSCMHYSSFLLGNSSSGIIEAASFNKFVINVGSRQQGRLSSDNVYACAVEYNSIMELVQKIELQGKYTGHNIYYHGGAASKIVEILREI